MYVAGVLLWLRVSFTQHAMNGPRCGRHPKVRQGVESSVGRLAPKCRALPPPCAAVTAYGADVLLDGVEGGHHLRGKWPGWACPPASPVLPARARPLLRSSGSAGHSDPSAFRRGSLAARKSRHSVGAVHAARCQQRGPHARRPRIRPSAIARQPGLRRSSTIPECSTVNQPWISQNRPPSAETRASIYTICSPVSRTHDSPAPAKEHHIARVIAGRPGANLRHNAATTQYSLPRERWSALTARGR